jgi:hypothetical protein
MNEDEKWFGKKLILDQDVIYIGDEENPKDNPYFQAWAKAFKEVYGCKEPPKEEEK